MKRRIALVGNDAVTAAIAARLVHQDHIELVLIGASPDRLAGELRAAIASDGGAARVLAGRQLSSASGASIVIAADPLHDLDGEQLAARCPTAVVIVAGDDSLSRTASLLKTTEFPRQRVIGLAGEPSAARLRSLLSAELGVWPAAVNVLALGGPGERMVLSAPVGVPADRMDAIVAQVRKLDGEGVGPALSAAVTDAMVAAITCDSRRVLVCAAQCSGEYGIDGQVVAVPVVLGFDGMQRIVELELDTEQLAALAAAAV